MNTVPCNSKFAPKWVCLLMAVAGVAPRVVVAGPPKVVVAVHGANHNNYYQASTIVDSAGFFYLQCL